MRPPGQCLRAVQATAGLIGWASSRLAPCPLLTAAPDAGQTSHSFSLSPGQHGQLETPLLQIRKRGRGSGYASEATQQANRQPRFKPSLPDRLKEHLGPGRLRSLPSGPRCLEQAVQTDGARGGGLLKETAKDRELADTGAWGLGGKRDPSSISPAWSKEPNLTR